MCIRNIHMSFSVVPFPRPELVSAKVRAPPGYTSFLAQLDSVVAIRLCPHVGGCELF